MSNQESRPAVPRGHGAGHTVHKVGGTSMSHWREVLDNVLIAGRTGGDLYNRIFVVSAYGGITDMLLEHKKTHEPGVFALYADADSDWAWGDALSRVAQEMCRINAEIFDDPADLKLADSFVRERVEGVRSCLIDLHRLCSFGHFKLQEHLMTVREMLAGLGEVHSAHNTALLLRSRGVEALFVDLSGWREPEQQTLDERISRVFADIDLSRQLPIATGYTQTRDGLMSTYDRGYSEVTFSRIACLTGAAEAIIHKEYHLSSADPKLVGEDQVMPIGRTNYDVADQLSNMGMEAIHPRAAKGLRQRGIPLRIMSTFEPGHAGTMICDGWRREQPGAEIVTGLRAIYELELYDQDMVGVPGSGHKVLEQLARHHIWSAATNANANAITHYLPATAKQMRQVVAALEQAFPNAEIQTRKVAMVSVIGSNMADHSLFTRAMHALDTGGIQVLAAHQPSRMVDLQFVVEERDFERATRLLHGTLVREPDSGDRAERGKTAAPQAA